MKVAQELVVSHNFDGGALARSFLDLSRRGHVGGKCIPELVDAFRAMTQRRVSGASEIGAMVVELERLAPDLPPPVSRGAAPIDYLGLAAGHNKRRNKR